MVTTAAMRPTFEEIENAIWNEAAAHRQNVTIAVSMLMSAEESQWVHQVQMLPRARHGDVKEAAFFLDLLAAVDRHVRRNAAIGYVEYKHGIPLLALRRMDRRQHKVVFIEMRLTSFGAGGLGWV